MILILNNQVSRLNCINKSIIIIFLNKFKKYSYLLKKELLSRG